MNLHLSSNLLDLDEDGVPEGSSVTSGRCGTSAPSAPGSRPPPWSRGCASTSRGCHVDRRLLLPKAAPGSTPLVCAASRCNSICALGTGSFRLTAIAQRTPNSLRIGVSEEEEEEEEPAPVPGPRAIPPEPAPESPICSRRSLVDWSIEHHYGI